jgi:hypothetical protein
MLNKIGSYPIHMVMDCRVGIPTTWSNKDRQVQTIHGYILKSDAESSCPGLLPIYDGRVNFSSLYLARRQACLAWVIGKSRFCLDR